MFKVFCVYCDKEVGQKPSGCGKVLPTDLGVVEQPCGNGCLRVICDKCYNDKMRGKVRPYLMRKKDEH